MSQPPVHRPRPSPRGLAGRRYFGLDFAALVALAEDLARERHGVDIPDKGRGLMRSLTEVSALLAHILAEHQSFYGREAFLATAGLPESLLKHARKLAYEPDMGVAATGFAAFTLKPGLKGGIEKGFALKSAPSGERKAQVYETLESLTADAAWNAMTDTDELVPTAMQPASGLLTIPLLESHGLERGEIAIIEGQGKAVAFEVDDPLQDAEPPAIRLRLLGGENGQEPWTPYGAGYRLLARPKIEARLFGWNADAGRYPPEKLSNPAAYAPPATITAGVRFGYKIEPDVPAPPPVPGSELLLAQAVLRPAPGELAVLIAGQAAAVLEVAGAADRSVRFVRGERVPLPQTPAAGTGGQAGSGLQLIAFANSGSVTFQAIAPVYSAQLIETSLDARVTVLSLKMPVSKAERTWSAVNRFPLDATVLVGWSKEIGIQHKVPNGAAFALDLTVNADLSAMRPGRPVMLQRRDTGAVREAVVVQLTAPAPPSAAWRLRLELPGGPLPQGWTKGNTAILGNVARISHGETKRETLGGSDGVTPHQRHAIKSAPLTRVAAAEGAEIALEVRVNGVLWDRVADFHGATPEDRWFKAETGADGKSEAVFGGSGRGAVPPGGKRHVEATYRVGLGSIGNTGPDTINRQVRSSPLVDKVGNPLAVRGGSDPAGPEDMRLQATRPVRTFGRAVSVSDYADLALLFPSAFRAAARWLDRGAVELVVAGADGLMVADPRALREFLDRRRDTAIPLALLEPQPADIVLALRAERHRDYLAGDVRLRLQEALIGADETAPGLFTFAGRDFSQSQALSGLYAELLRVEGVNGVLASRFDIHPGAAVRDTIHATGRQWLRLTAPNLTLDIVEPGSLVPMGAEATP